MTPQSASPILEPLPWATRSVRPARRLRPTGSPLQLDRQRVEEIQAQRAELATGYMDTLAEQWPGAVEEAIEKLLNESVRVALADTHIGDLLDIGTGTGRMLRLLGDRAEQAVGVDISSEMLMVARTNLHAAGLGRCMVRPGDMYTLPYPNESFDTVTMDQVLIEAADPVTALSEAARILRPAGQLVVVELINGMAPRDTGIDPDSFDTWLGQAGLVSTKQEKLPAEEPAVMICLARRELKQDEVAA